MIKSDMNEEIIYKVSRMLDYEMENLQTDIHAKAELLVMFKYVLTHIDEFRDILDVEEEYTNTVRNMMRRG